MPGFMALGWKLRARAVNWVANFVCWSRGDTNAGVHGAWLKADRPSRKLSGKFWFILSIGQFVLLCFNFSYSSTFALMPRGHILSFKRKRKYAKKFFECAFSQPSFFSPWGRGKNCGSKTLQSVCTIGSVQTGQAQRSETDKHEALIAL